MSLLRPDPAAAWVLMSCAGLLLGASNLGCVHVYQPMSGLHEPVVVDTSMANFPDLRLTVFCDRGELLSALKKMKKSPEDK